MLAIWAQCESVLIKLKSMKNCILALAECTGVDKSKTKSSVESASKAMVGIAVRSQEREGFESEM